MQQSVTKLNNKNLIWILPQLLGLSKSDFNVQHTYLVNLKKALVLGVDKKFIPRRRWRE